MARGRTHSNLARIVGAILVMSAALSVVACGNRPLSVSNNQPGNPISQNTPQTNPTASPTTSPGVGTAGANLWYQNPVTSSNTDNTGSLSLTSAGTGTFTSHVFNSKVTGQNWTNLSWSSNRPVGIPLPNGGKSDPAADPATGLGGFTHGIVNMTGNTLLVHSGAMTGTTVADSSGMAGAGGTCTMCPTAGAAGAGIFGSGLNFNGTTQTIGFSNVSAISGTGSFSVTFWFKAGAGASGVMLKQRDLTGFHGEWQVTINQQTLDQGTAAAPGIVRFEMWDSTSVFVGSTQKYDDGNWHNLVAIRDATGMSLSLYIDGRAAATPVPLTAQTLIGIQAYQIYAGSSQAKDSYFTGSLDEVAVFNRALTPAEAYHIFSRGQAQVQLQARACSTPTCSDNPAFSTAVTGSPVPNSNVYSVPLSGVSGQYFQFQVKLADPGVAPPTGTALVLPKINSVSTSPALY